MTSQSGRGRARAFFLGAASLLVVELVVVGVSRWSPSTTVAGVAHVSAAAVAEPARAPAPPAPATSVPAAPTSQAAPPAAAPITVSPPPPRPQPRGSIRLPGGGTATMVRKELGPDDALPVPDNLGEAAEWGAALNAATGASVFAGHVNWNGATGPFAELWSARIDEPVTIVDPGGKTWAYRISQLITVHKDDLARRADELFGQQGAHRVVLVTCGGEWIGGETGYDENRVVIAEQG